MRHGNQQDREGQRGGDDEFARHLMDFGMLIAREVFTFGCRGFGGVSGILHGGDQTGNLYQDRIILNGGPRGREIHAGLPHARRARQRLFHPCRTRGAAHPLDGQIHPRRCRHVYRCGFNYINHGHIVSAGHWLACVFIDQPQEFIVHRFGLLRTGTLMVDVLQCFR